MRKACFSQNGFVCLPDVLPGDECASLAARLDTLADRAAGNRGLLAQPWCQALGVRLQAHPALAGLVPAGHRAVQCTFFEKSAARNWLVSAHQDTAIPVARRTAHPALHGWSCKQGQWFVQAPADILGELLALRLHLDDCDANDGPLHVWPGSHRLGVLGEAAADLRHPLQHPHWRKQVCTLARGGVLVLRPLLLHASAKSTGHSRRRCCTFCTGRPACRTACTGPAPWAATHRPDRRLADAAARGASVSWAA